MKSEEFHAVVEKLGKEKLSPLGFEYKKQRWFYVGTRYVLQLWPMAQRLDLSTKYFLLRLGHPQVPVNKAIRARSSSGKNLIDRDKYEIDPNLYPLDIAPSMLESFCHSGLSPVDWYQRFDGQVRSDGIYYGNKERHFGLNPSDFQKLLDMNHVDYIDEAEALQRLERLFNSVRDHSFHWAESLKPKSAFEVIKKRNLGWLGKVWVEIYSDYLKKNAGKS